MNRSFIKKFSVAKVLSATVFFVLCSVTLVFVSCASRLSATDMNALDALGVVEASSTEGTDILSYARNLIEKHYGISELVSVDEFCKESISAAKRLDEMAATFGNATAGENSEVSADETTGENENGTQNIKKLVVLYYELCKLAAMLHDGHTVVYMPQEIIPCLEYYPINASVIGGKIVVTAISTEYDNVVGKAVVELNGKTFDEVITALKTIISYDTESYALASVAKQLNIRQSLDFVGLGSDDGSLRIKLDDGNEISFNPLSYDAFNELSFNSLVTSVERTLYTKSFYECYDLSADTLFIQYNTCMNADGYSVADFSNDVLGFIDNNGFSRVIIDLRFNGGGNSMLLDPFIKQLGKRISAGQCKGFALIGTNTFSSAVLNAWDLKKAGCTLVGTPTGGAINHYGELGYLTLPHSGINTTYSTKHFVLDPKASPGSIQPDVLVELSVEDWRNGHDSQVAACLEM